MMIEDTLKETLKILLGRVLEGSHRKIVFRLHDNIIKQREEPLCSLLKEQLNEENKLFSYWGEETIHYRIRITVYLIMDYIVMVHDCILKPHYFGECETWYVIG